MILSRGGTNGKFIWSSRAVEERIEKSTAGSPTVYCGTSGFGKLKLERASYIVSLGSKSDQLSAKEAMGEDPKGSQPTSGAAKTTGSTHVKRTISAAGRKRIAAAQRARWAKVKAAGKKKAD
jgi:hypothetical protein